MEMITSAQHNVNGIVHKRNRGNFMITSDRHGRKEVKCMCQYADKLMRGNCNIPVGDGIDWIIQERVNGERRDTIVIYLEPINIKRKRIEMQRIKTHFEASIAFARLHNWN